MSFIYVIRTGNIYHDSEFIGNGYSGHGAGLNNPAMCASVGIGPLPVGRYTIGQPHTPVGHLGPLAMPLLPNPATVMHHRSGMFIHGDNRAMNFSASNGCIILGKPIRELINKSSDRVLDVIAEEKRNEEKEVVS